MFYIAVTYPVNCGFEIVVAIRVTVQEITCKHIGWPCRFTEASFCVFQPGAIVRGVSEFLVCRCIPTHADSSKPFQLLLPRAGAEIDHQLVSKNSVLVIYRKIAKAVFLNCELIVDIAAYCKRALLAVNDFVTRFFTNCPMHRAKWEASQYCVDNRALLLV